jgi:hypothetical protein
MNNPQVGDIIASTQPANLRSDPPGYFFLTGWTLPSKIGVVLPSVAYTVREIKEVDGGYYWLRVERND